jgi:hypothetical protein
MARDTLWTLGGGSDMAKPSEKTAREQKKAYRAPTLRAFGNVQQITQTIVGGMGKADNFMERKTGIAVQ